MNERLLGLLIARRLAWGEPESRKAAVHAEYHSDLR
jgi:hypothetical protein